MSAQLDGDGVSTAHSINGPAVSHPAGVKRPWARDAAQVLGALHVDPSQGLSESEVEKRLAQYGKNQLREMKDRSIGLILVDQFRSLVVGLLVVAAVVSFVTGGWLEGMAVLIVVAVNAAIGFATELRAVRSMEALRRLGLASAKVRRDSKAREISASLLVPGDIVLIEAGDIVTADLRLLEASKVQADESTLTGESAPVRKEATTVEGQVPLAERSSMLFKGTAVTRGSAESVVVATGMSTELGRIASLAQAAEKTATPLELRLQQLGRRLIWGTLAIAFATTVAGILRGKDALLMIETGIALAVAAIPEGLPIVATLALARGMWRLARRHALINRLSAVETLGATGIILTDKTGTLTENRMTVVRLALPNGDVEVASSKNEEGTFLEDGEPVNPERMDIRTAIEIGLLCNNASLELGEGERGEARTIGDPMEVAFLFLGAKAGVDRLDLLNETPERREEAFDPATRAMATFHECDGSFRVAVKGAAEAVLVGCRRRIEGNGVVELTDDDRQRWLERNEELAHEGLRVLALAEKTAISVDDEPYEDLTFVGLVGILDPPRQDTKVELARCREAGLRVVMITGDQAGTAASIARSLDLDDGKEPVLGRDLPEPESMTDEERRYLLGVSVFARVDPEQKLDLIELHQDAGSIVAMTGDGVNDAPALRKADIGVAMGQRGTQVAREAADMVLRDDAFSSIVEAIHQGRVILSNIRRFVLYLLSCNISEILIVFLASVGNAPLPILPLQILYLNLVTDVFPALALGFLEGEEGVMMRPPRDPQEALLTRSHWIAIGLYGLLISACVLVSLWLALRWLGLGEGRAVTVSFLTLAFAQVWHVLNMRQHDSKLLSNDVVRSGWVWGAIALCTLLLIAAVHLPGLNGVLGTENPGTAGWVLALVASVVPLVVGQAWHELRRIGWP